MAWISTSMPLHILSLSISSHSANNNQKLVELSSWGSDKRSTMEDSQLATDKRDQVGSGDNAGEKDSVDEKECNDESEMKQHLGDGNGEDEEKKDGSDEKREMEEEDEPPSEIVHSSLSTLACEIDEFVSKLGYMRIEMQRKEEEELKRKKDEEIWRGSDDKNEIIDEEILKGDECKDEKKNEQGKDNDLNITTGSDEKPADVDKDVETGAESDDAIAKQEEKNEASDEKVVEEAVKAALEVPDSVDNFVSLVEAKIVNYEFSQGTEKWWKVEEAEPPFFDNVARLHNLANALRHFSQSEPEYAASFNRVGSVLHKAMLFTEEELMSILEDTIITTADPNSDVFKDASDGAGDEGQSSSNEIDFLGYSADQILDLNKLAMAMISAGYDTECCQVYFIMRRNIFEGTLIKNFGFEKTSIDEVLKMNWETLGREICTWNSTFKQCGNVNFRGERRLAASIFTDEPLISDLLFTQLTKKVIMQLLNFAEAVAMTKHSAEKLFKVLDMYETIQVIVPTLDEFFPEQCVNEVKPVAFSAKRCLGEAAVCIFCELENSIKSDTNRTPVPGGAVHPLTRYTINYLKYACEYKTTLEQVFRDHHKVERADSTSAPDYEIPNHIDVENARDSPFIVQLIKVLDLLDAYIDSKSKLYKDVSLSYIFLMNNGRYILQRIRSDINELMGDSWCRKRSSDLRTYHKNYQRETWGKLLQCLTQEGLNVNGKVPKPVLKERFKNFNAMFDEIHRTQSTWIVSDEQLQSELRVSISAVVIPAYRAFLGRFNQYFTPGRQTEKYVKYQSEDIEASVEELFDGKKKP